MIWRKLTIVPIVALTCMSIAACGGESEAEEAVTSTVTSTVTETVERTTTVTETTEAEPEPTRTAESAAEEPAASTSGSAGTFGSGPQLVGSDIQPGTYRNSDSSNMCYWERLSGHSGEIDDIIANELTESQSVVTIAPTDVAFSSTDCGTWTLVE